MKHRYSIVHQGIATAVLIAFMSIAVLPTFAAEDDARDKARDVASCCYSMLCLTLCLVGYSVSADVRYMPSAQFLGRSPDYVDQYIEMYQGLRQEAAPRPSALQRVFRAFRSLPVQLARVLGS